MDCNQQVLSRLKTAKERATERTQLWNAIQLSFEKEGPDGVSTLLQTRIEEIQADFDATLAKLEAMLGTGASDA